MLARFFPKPDLSKYATGAAILALNFVKSLAQETDPSSSTATDYSSTGADTPSDDNDNDDSFTAADWAADVIVPIVATSLILCCAYAIRKHRQQEQAASAEHYRQMRV